MLESSCNSTFIDFVAWKIDLKFFFFIWSLIFIYPANDI